MADFAAIAGILGAMTGIVALIISIKSYLLVATMKAIDMRLELEKAFINLDLVTSGIDSYLDFVHQSHTRVFAATGLNQSGAMKLFEEDFAKNRARLRGLLGSQPRRKSSYDGHSPRDLENLLVEVHALHVQIAAIREKYQKLFESDEERQAEIRAVHQP